MLVITGVLRGYEEGDLTETILMENEDPENKFREAFRQNFKRSAEMRRRRHYLETSLEIFKFLISKEKIVIEEALNLS